MIKHIKYVMTAVNDEEEFGGNFKNSLNLPWKLLYNVVFLKVKNFKDGKYLSNDCI